MKPKNDVLQSTLTLLVLRTLKAKDPVHCYALTSHVQQVSADLLRVEEGISGLSDNRKSAAIRRESCPYDHAVRTWQRHSFQHDGPMRKLAGEDECGGTPKKCSEVRHW